MKHLATHRPVFVPMRLARALVVGVAVLAATGCSDTGPTGRRVIVLGIDGMDYGLTRRLVDEGSLPNLAGMAGEGSFMPLATSMPPLSPVAWTSFITGLNPGGHGVFDFLRREPGQVGTGFSPLDGTTRFDTVSPAESQRIPLTEFVLPPPHELSLVRRGASVWELLESAGYRATVYKIPANYPVSASAGQTLAGMGTPDIEGGYGTYTYFTSRSEDWDKPVTGGRIVSAVVQDGRVTVFDEGGQETAPWLTGPVNPFVAGDGGSAARRATVPIDVFVDPQEATAAIAVQGQELVLKQGEWSAWVRVEFELLPHVKSLHGLVRFYLQEAGAHIRLFASPINLAPGTEGLATGGFDMDLLEALGPYYTKGMPEQTKALTDGIFSTDEYLVQAGLVLDEQLGALDYLLDRVEDGLLFFYLSTLDPSSHVLWAHRDPDHPAYDRQISPRYAGEVERLYVRMDEITGRVVGQLRPGDELYVMSDHGFASLRREFNLPRWLEQEGYLAYKSAPDSARTNGYGDIDWRATRAYGVGFQGLYVNLVGREASGQVDPADYEALVEEIRGELLALRDDGARVFHGVYRADEIYTGPELAAAPDLVLGFERGYGPSDDGALGRWAEDVIAPRLSGFSGHHAVDAALVPGILLSTRVLSTRVLPGRDARLEDLTVTLLKEFNVAAAPEMTGRPLY